jgi:hypothetical protein
LLHMSANTIDLTITLPITPSAHQQARAFAQEQPTTAKAQQVYLNTLAVLVVRDYLNLLDVPTDLEASDCWNPVGRLCADVADLVLPGWGRLECRPVHLGDLLCPVPPDAWSDRRGYLVVQIDQTSHQGTVLGFASSATSALPIQQLQPLDALLMALHAAPEASQAPVASSVSGTIPWVANAAVHLSQWFEQAFDASWQEVTAVLAPPQVGLAFRSSATRELPETPSGNATDEVRRAKLVDLGMQLGNSAIALMITLTPGVGNQVGIHLQVHPVGSKYLPPNLRLMIQDQAGETTQIQARSADNYIQLRFSGAIEELFSVTIALGEVSVTEQFVI